MKLSVIIPTYNRKDSLRCTLDGLSRQEYPFDDFEVLVVSDGSTDGTGEMLADYMRTAPYAIQYICQLNGGPAKARNRGIQEAQYEIIVFLDDDVEPTPAFLRCHARHHERNEKIAVVGPMSPDPACSGEEPVWIAWEHAKLQAIYTMFRPGGRYAGCPAGTMHFYSGNASVRKKWLILTRGFDETYTRQEDVELAVRLQQTCGVTFVMDFEADGIHRPHRSYESWLRIPNAYGAFDRQRVDAGLLRQSYIISNLKKRSLVTRSLALLCMACPRLQAPLEKVLRKTSIGFYRLGQKYLAIAVLSCLYNVAYIMACLRPEVLHPTDKVNSL